MAATGAGATTEAQQPLAGLKVCIDGSRTLLRELEKAGTAPPEELAKVQDLLECLDRNAEQIASALAGSRRRKSTDALGAVASLLREQDQYFQQCALPGSTQDVTPTLQTITTSHIHVTASECIFCGEVMIKSIHTPFITPDDELSEGAEWKI